MEDSAIIELFLNRQEEAIRASLDAYGPYCHSIALRILESKEDAEECVNDTVLHAWNAIPPAHPNVLRYFLGRICRNLALDRWRSLNRQKRSPGRFALSLDELSEVISSDSKDARSAPDYFSEGAFRGSDSSGADFSPEAHYEVRELTEAITRFLSLQSAQKRIIFLQRYWYFYSIEEIASHLNVSAGSVKMTLNRLRKELRQYLKVHQLL